MPELGRFEKSFRPGWIRPYRKARSEAPSDRETSDAVVTALCRSLREFGGVPGFKEIAEVLTSHGGRPAWPQLSAIEETLRKHNGHRHTEIASQAAKSILLEQAAGDGLHSGQSLVKEFAIRTCHGLLDHYYFALARSNLVAEGVYADPVAARRWQSRVEGLLDDRIEHIAEKLIDNPGAVRLRAPRRTVPQQSTKDLIDENLLPQTPEPVGQSSTGGS